MVSLIIPSAGKSSRFLNKPKWLRTTPNGNLMIQECIHNINLDRVSHIYITVLREHIDTYCDGNLNTDLFNFTNKQVDIFILENCTSSQPETVVKTINHFKIKGSIFIKDVDSFFGTEIIQGNVVSYVDLNDYDITNVCGKSYVTFNSEKEVTSIVEKTVTSNYICVGGYSFNDTSVFIEGYNRCIHTRDINHSELYISHIIHTCILNGITFKGSRVDNYVDVGTEKEWINYTSLFKTIFVDIDGTLFKNANQHFNPVWGDSEPLLNNINIINKLYENNKTYTILTTSRKSSFKEKTIAQLDKFNVKYHKILFDLPHCKRFLINDFSPTNPYPSAISINIERDANNLHTFLG